jgi:hypothetical protein
MSCWVKTDDEGSGWPMFYTGRKKVIQGGKETRPQLLARE